MSQQSLVPQPLVNSVNITLISSSSVFDPIERVLFEKEALRLGRQVKTATDNNEQSELQDTPQAFFVASVALETGNNNNKITDAEATVEIKNQQQDGTSPFPAAPSQPIQKISPVWFKSKVVSRIHAEIWLKGGQVNI